MFASAAARAAQAARAVTQTATNALGRFQKNGIMFNTRSAVGADAATLTALLLSIETGLLDVHGNELGAHLVQIKNSNKIEFKKSNGDVLEFKIIISNQQIYFPAELVLSINFNPLVTVLDGTFPRGWWWESVGNVGEALLNKVITQSPALRSADTAAFGGYRRKHRKTHRKHRKSHRKNRSNRKTRR